MNNTSQYTRRLTLAVPEAMMIAANQLALVMGLSAEDVNTFRVCMWQDSEGNHYSVCSTAATENTIAALSYGLPTPLPEHAVEADTAAAQRALDLLEVFQYEDETSPTTQAAPQYIVIVIDKSPLPALEAMGLTRIEEEI